MTENILNSEEILSRLTRSLDGEPDTGQPQKPTSDQEPLESEDESEPDDDDEGEDGDLEDGDDVDLEEDEEELTADDKGVSIELDGKTITLTPEEVREAYSKSRDYQHKTTKLAEERRSVEAERDRYGKEIQALTQAMQGIRHFLTGGDDIEKRIDQAYEDGDTETVLRLQREKDKRAKAQGEFDKYLETLDKARQEEQQKAYQQHLAYVEQELQAKRPELLKDQKRQEALSSFLTKDLGFTKEQLPGLMHPELLMALDDARRWRAAVSKKDAARPKAPKTLKGRGRPQGVQETKRTSVQKARHALKARGGRIDDASKLIAHLI